MTVRSNNNSLIYLIFPTFSKFSRLFVLPFEIMEGNNVKKDHRDSLSRYYVPNVQIKDFNVLIDGKSFYDFPIKNQEEAYEKIINIGINSDW